MKMRVLEKVNIVSYTEVNKAVKEAFNLDEFHCELESANDMDYLHEGITNKPLDTWDENDWEEAIESKGCEYYRTDLALNALCIKGKIEPGNYIVKVSW